MLGLRSALVVVTIVLLAVGYLVVTIFSTDEASPSVWTAQILGLVLGLAVIMTSVLIPTDPLPMWASVMLAVTSLTALGLGWWHMTNEDFWWVQVTVPPALTAVFAGFLALRGRAGLAWLVLIGATIVAAVWLATAGESIGLMFSMTNRILGTVLPATIIATEATTSTPAPQAI